ncbi:hypothetical protein B0T16DRAFT_418248 [Cercophora newfieldiana]|uniref:Uncharacterized protein n=1 Tax=Cercophora newfieldiana TaxID=92897 RepID=A0AA39XX27_9PEZI|nr:hypothetical protein B0T16DRAFT_418248 [Cercophora newfieldiana]
MEMTTEAIIALVALVVGLPATGYVMWKCHRGRRGRTPGDDTAFGGEIQPPLMYFMDTRLTRGLTTCDQMILGTPSFHLGRKIRAVTKQRRFL